MTKTLSPEDRKIDEERATRRRQEESDLKRKEATRLWNDVQIRMGKRYENATFDSFQCLTDDHRWKLAELRGLSHKPRCGLILHGPRGTGKDHLAVACLRVAALEQSATTDWIDGQDLFQLFRDGMSKEATERDSIARFTRAQILLISDPLPQEGKLTEWQQSILWRIVDRRYRDLKTTWVTVNCKDGKEMSQRLGAQITDRLTDGALTISTNGWSSYRKPAGGVR